MGVYAFADVIWEPNNDFYKTHSDKCEYVGPDYYANGESGYMELFSEPGGASLGFSDNGAVFHTQFSFNKDDETWGVGEYIENNGKLVPINDSNSKTGWFKLSDAVLKYDYQSFDEDHSKEYNLYSGNYSELKDKQNIVVWTFPNSGETNSTIDKIDENFSINSVYTDIDGIQWGFVSYYYGMKNFWVCLSNPTDATLAAKDVPVPEIHKAVPNSEPDPTDSDMTTAIIICVTAAILCTAVLFAALNRKKQGKVKK
jgi:hypothetical protein